MIVLLLKKLRFGLYRIRNILSTGGMGKGLRKFTLGNNGVEPTYEIMIEPVP